MRRTGIAAGTAAGVAAAALLDRLLAAREPAEFADHWQRICGHFDLLYHAPETIGQLRQTILQLAVQGKLVPQDPNDEPVSTLCERLRDSRQRYWEDLEAAKTVARGSSPQRSERQKSFEDFAKIEASELPVIPKSWWWLRVSEIGEVQLGRQRAPR